MNDYLGDRVWLVFRLHWDSQNESFPNATATFWAYSSGSSSGEFALKVRNCKKANSDPLAPKLSCIAIQNYSGAYATQFNMLYDVFGPAKLSHDGQFIALFRKTGISVSSSERLEIYNRSGDLVSSYPQDETAFQWLPDGKILSLSGRNFRFTDPYATKPIYQLTLPDNLPGTPGQLSVSPDGQRIAFSIIDSSNFATTHATPYVMNIDGKNIRKLATTPDDSPVINNPIWSPDGQWILLAEGGASGQDSNTPGVQGYLYVIPSNADRVMVLSIIDSEKSPEAIRLNRYFIGSDLPGNAITKRFPSWGVAWLP